MNQLRYYISLYTGFVSTSLSAVSSFRLHFLLLIFMDVFFYCSTLLSVNFIYQFVETIGVWTKDEFMFFLAFMIAVDFLHMVLISENYWGFSDLIRTGQLDYFLVRPGPAMFSVFFNHVRLASLGCLPIVSALLLYHAMKLHFVMWQWLLLTPLLFCSLTLLVCIEILLCCSMFWLIDGTGINFLRLQFQQVTRWPDFIFSGVAQKMFTIVIPLLLVGNAPVRFLFNPFDYRALVVLIVMITIFVIAIRIVWNLGLRRYESASS